MKISNAVAATAAWIIMALLFNAGIYFVEGQQKALEFLTGYLIELSLSIDNLFVFFLIFSHFKIDLLAQRRILYWGILGAQLMRALFILGGISLLGHFSWVIYAFGVLLIAAGMKLFLKQEGNADPAGSFPLNLLKRVLPAGIAVFWLVLLAIELADLIFAVDSIPAVLAITKDPFIVYSSNIFAILGLRAIYLALTPVFDMFDYLHFALGIILVFVGFKMLVDHSWHIPTGYSLIFIVSVLAVFITASFLKNKTRETV